MKTYRIITVITAAVMLLAGKAMAGGSYGIQWDNDGSQNNGPFVVTSDAAGTQKLPVGDLIELVASTGGSTFTVLASGTIGSLSNNIANQLGNPNVAGFYDIATAVTSNVLQGVIGDPLGIVFFAGTSPSAPYGYVYNPTVTSPSPDWVFPPSGPVIVEPDPTDPNWVVLAGNGATSAGINNTVSGFYAAVPEPSTVMLVVMGLLGGIGMMRRRRS